MFLVTILSGWLRVCSPVEQEHTQETKKTRLVQWNYEGWNFNSGNYLFTTDTK